MKISFRTNLDVYRQIMWDSITKQLEQSNHVPRVNEIVAVPDEYVSYCRNKNVPPRLTVVSVTYYQSHVSVELWYGETDFKLYNSDGKLLERS